MKNGKVIALSVILSLMLTGCTLLQGMKKKAEDEMPVTTARVLKILNTPAPDFTELKKDVSEYHRIRKEEREIVLMEQNNGTVLNR